MNFEKYNANPKGKKTGDCVIRALTKALNKDYWEVVDDLVDVYKKKGYIINSKEGYKEYLKQLGYEMQKQPRHNDNTKYTVEQFADTFKKGTYILNLANHLTILSDGTLYDLWNCKSKCVGNYWKVR